MFAKHAWQNNIRCISFNDKKQILINFTYHSRFDIIQSHLHFFIYRKDLYFEWMLNLSENLLIHFEQEEKYPIATSLTYHRRDTGFKPVRFCLGL